MSDIPYLAEISITPVEDGVIMKMSHNFSAVLQYSLDGADFQPCDEADLQSCKYTTISECMYIYAHVD